MREQCSSSSWPPRSRCWSHCLSCAIGLKLFFFYPPYTAGIRVCCLLARALSMLQEGKRRKDRHTLEKDCSSLQCWTWSLLPMFLTWLLIWPQPVTLEVSPCPAYYTHKSSEVTDLPGSFQEQQTQSNYGGLWMNEWFIAGLGNAIIVAWDRGIWCCIGHQFMCEALSIDLCGLNACWRWFLYCATWSSFSWCRAFKANNFQFSICQWMCAI